METEEELSQAAIKYDLLERRILEERAQGNLSEESEDRILDVMDRLWRKMTREERAVIDAETGRRRSMEKGGS